MKKESIIQRVIIDWMLLVNSFTDISLIMVVCGEDASWAVGNVLLQLTRGDLAVRLTGFLTCQSSQAKWT